MGSVLELPGFQSRAKLLSVEEYHKLGELGFLSQRTELIEGVVIQKMPKSPKHATVIALLLKIFLKQMGFESVRSEQPLALLRSEPEPDIVIVPGKIEDYRNSHPTTALLVIEVSLTTLLEDRRMASIYAESNIPEYWLVNLNNQTVEVFRSPTNGEYSSMEIFSADKTLTPVFDPTIQVVLKELF